MSVKIYSYDKCSTCKKALGFLKKKDVDVEVVDITAKPPTKKDLKAMLGVYDGELRKLFNTSGQVYREMKLGDKLATMDEGKALDLLAANGKLIKRPFLLVDGKPAAVGFNEQEWKKVVR